MREQVLREEAQYEERGHAAVDLQFADAFGILEFAERFGSPQFQLIRCFHAGRNREQSGRSGHGAERYHGHFLWPFTFSDASQRL